MHLTSHVKDGDLEEKPGGYKTREPYGVALERCGAVPLVLGPTFVSRDAARISRTADLNLNFANLFRALHKVPNMHHDNTKFYKQQVACKDLQNNM